MHLQISHFCIWKNICAADLRILCTTVFCTFAHLHICTFAHLHICEFRICTFAESCTQVKIFLRTCANKKNCFLQDLHRNFGFCQNSSKSEKRRKMSKCQIRFRRFLTCSRKCPKKAHVFLSGTRVVPGPTRLTTQGGKSRQNMH